MILQSLKYSFQKDKIVWWLLLIGILLLFCLELKSDIPWPAWVEPVRIVGASITSGIIVSSVFYLLTISIFEFKRIKNKLHFISNNLLNSKMIIKEILGVFVQNLEHYSWERGDFVLSDRGQIYVSQLCADFKKEENKILDDMEFLPIRLQEKIDNLYFRQSIKRIYHNNFKQIFNKNDIEKFIREIENADIEYIKLVNNIESLQKS